MGYKFERTLRLSISFSVKHFSISVAISKQLASAAVNAIEIFIFRALIDSYISHGEFVSVNNVLREYNDMKKEIIQNQTVILEAKLNQY